MKFAICNELYGDQPFDQSFAHMRELGYEGVEIAPFTIETSAFDISSARRSEIRDLAAANDLAIVGLHWLLAKTTGLHLTHADPDVRKKTIEYLKELVRLCADLGGSLMVFGSPPQRNLPEGTSHEVGIQRAIEVFENVVPTLEQCGVLLALEPLGPEEGNFLLTADSAIELAKAIDSPQVQLHLDVKAMSAETIPIPEIIRRSREWLVHFHANDPNRRGPGMGNVDFTPIVAALKEIAYDGWISVEVFDYSPGVDVLARESIEYLKRIWHDQ